ncbi:MAG: electron transfer flavoprotein subunit alpha/FixB family protein [Sediminibacterium sp. Gen4]|jgi:electron transfer flavoprotein alpha subunit|uniref:electron transfer flavoprotein subunit alpha/FixB family protein n=1 Tax=unclassified Sediminibacterium TaxID=2635961 RepID=UPI0015BB5B54|nr:MULTISPECIES: electron transfer flavoprotein subunit alpha/FixB family protein [unclassified Sediminibacterium]MBW0160165.1 electron transfer flavoprotein subunit alpha/FixB family protein [Sediminibacterium sp.]MBW0164696.1 electron transfer flavoprotein subunit alpha/FixB family protein [Sediminibacterium sp.]NWK65986.1 electron transfer flavoprotein subunit alpha/FixB family protein [Sediminibacterium sp. Gen4]
MSVLIFVDQSEGHIKKASFEALTYGVKVAEQLGTTAEALVLGSVSDDLASLGKYGVKKVHQVNNASLNQLDAQVYAKVIAEAATQSGANVVVFSHNQTGKAVAARVAVRLKAGLVAGACALPDTGNGFVVRKTVFSGKAFANVSITSAVKVISLNPNSYTTIASEGTAEVNQLSIAVDTPKVKVTAVNKVSGEVPLTEAEIVVSGGRGLKGPENWGILLDLAKELGAATACSRPVGDAHWRPHHEHVGQTGVQVAPNLYIAIGISGAIQHLAGVNRSKVIVVINKDPEAPFFKAADYGIVGDAFEVVPKLTEEIKKLKAK